MKMKKALAIGLSATMIMSVTPGEVLAADLDADVTVEESTDVVDVEETVASEEPEVIEDDSDQAAEAEFSDEELDERQMEGQEVNDGDDSVLFSDGEEDIVNVEDGDDYNIQWHLEDTDSDGFDDTLVINGSGPMLDYVNAKDYPWYPYANSVSNLVIGDYITDIGISAFENFKTLKSVTLGPDIVQIESSAFKGCTQLPSIVITRNVDTIGWYAFQDCSSLKNVTLSDGVLTIGEHAFDGCTSLENLRMSMNLETIGAWGFYNCKNLKKMFLPITLKKIGKNALFQQNSAHTSHKFFVSDIHYPGLESDWEKIEGSSIREEIDEHYGSSILEKVHYVAHHEQKSATCTTSGFEEYWTCNKCGQYAFADIECTQKLDAVPKIPALGHNLDQGVVSKEANCTEEGSITYSCQRDGCDYTETQTIPTNQDHIYGEPSYVWNEDNTECTALEICSRCEHEETETVKAQETTLIPATCSQTGKAQYTAAFSNSDFKTQDKEVTVPKLAHTNTEIKNQKDATCENSGYSGDAYCKDCGEFLSEGSIIKAKGHLWDDGTVEKEPTCVEKGERVYTCFRCNKTKSEKIEAVGHKWNDKETTDLKATCTTSGRKSIHCSVCDEIQDDSQQIIPALGHNWSEGVVEKKATCTENGMQVVTCLRCGEEKEEEIPATGHTIARDAKIPATCEKDGLTEGSHCSVCGKVLTEQKTIPATGHAWDTGKIAKEATCEETGEKTYTCANCGAIKTEDIKAFGHKVVQDVAVESTCTKTGKTEGSHCSVCGKIFKEQEETVLKAHTFTAWRTTTAATVLASAKQTRKCSVCGKIETRNYGSSLKPSIKVNTGSILLKTNQKTTILRVSGLAKGDAIVSWKSSNTGIVKVYGRTNGTCTIQAGNRSGKATITVMLRSKLKKNIVVTVQKTTVKTTKITGVPTKLSLKKNQSSTLRPTLYPMTSGEKVTYQSSNTKIATVNSKGQVKAKNKGTVIITVKSGRKAVKCKVTVK